MQRAGVGAYVKKARTDPTEPKKIIMESQCVVAIIRPDVLGALRKALHAIHTHWRHDQQSKRLRLTPEPVCATTRLSAT